MIRQWKRCRRQSTCATFPAKLNSLPFDLAASNPLNEMTLHILMIGTLVHTHIPSSPQNMLKFQVSFSSTLPSETNQNCLMIFFQLTLQQPNRILHWIDDQGVFCQLLSPPVHSFQSLSTWSWAHFTAARAACGPPGKPRSFMVSAMSMKGMTKSVPGPPYSVCKKVCSICRIMSQKA